LEGWVSPKKYVGPSQLSVRRKQTKLEEKETSRGNSNPSKNGNIKNELGRKKKLAKVCVSHR
jgi:hypothetical protein